MPNMQQCELCRREVKETTEHHLIPRARHKVYKRKKDFDTAVLHRTISVCRPCHKNVHALFTEKELAESYYTVELLLANPEVRKFTEWVSKRPDMHLRVRKSNAKGVK
ncbi:MAG: HNH endonuclease [Blastocatellia bacterium]|nr:HNH endonuclease [Blastocatellia bacterium]